VKLLLLADAHGDYRRIPSILEWAGRVDACVMAGDLTNFGPASLAERLVEMLPEPLLAVAGNCDPRDVHESVERVGGLCLHGDVQSVGGVVFMGMGGSNPTPFNTPFELEEEEMSAILARMMEQSEGLAGMRVLVSHAPPYGVQDEVGRGHVGSHAVAAMLGKVDAILCGHIHEAWGVSTVRGTTVVNPGPAFEGRAALVWLDDDGVRAELLEVDEVDS